MNKQDIELCERAARAAGVAIDWDRPREYGALPIIRHANGTDTYWEPLDNKAQAFDLQVALRIDVWHDDESPIVWANYMRPGHFSQDREFEEYGDDPSAATRRAIVRAAAEMAP